MVPIQEPDTECLYLTKDLMKRIRMDLSELHRILDMIRWVGQALEGVLRALSFAWVGLGESLFQERD
jgi:hypothetical protein